MMISFRFLSILVLLLCGQYVLSQNQFAFGDSLTNEKGIISHQLSDGTVWVVGSSISTSGVNMDVVAVRIDTGGNILSKFHKYGTPALEYPNNMIYQNGKLIIAGEQHDANGVDGFILVIDTLGNLVSFQNYGQLNKSEQFFDIKPTSDGGFVVSGFSSVGPGNDFLIGKFDSLQQLEWIQTHDLGTNDIGVTVLENPNGGYLIAGDQLQPSGNYNVAVLSVDATGNALWNTVITNPFNGGCKRMISLGNKILIVGEISTSTSASFDIYMIQIDWQGNLQWQKTIPKTDKSDACFDAYFNNLNEIILTGYVYSTITNTSDMFAIVVDTLGNIINEEYYHNGAFEMGYDIKPNIYGGVIVTGFTIDPIDGDNEFFVSFEDFGINTSIKKINEYPLSFHLFPNPTKLRVFLPKELVGYKLKIFDLLGKEYLPIVTGNQVNIKGFHKGMYLFVFVNERGEAVYSHRILKE